MKILCYIYDGMADFDITFLLHRLRNTGDYEIVSISDSTDKIMAQSGLEYVPANKIDDVTDLEDVEALIIPGGPINNQQNSICPFIKNMISNGKLVAAICFAPQFLGRAGVLKEYKYTTSCSENKIKQLGCDDPFVWSNYIDQRVVVDRNVITAQGYAFVDFAEAVCDYLSIFKDDMQKYEQIERVKENEISS